jgi:hypothetical protein
MPVLRYFLFVGGALLVLLLGVNVLLPPAPVTDSVVSSADIPTIRIHSDQKWPERVVFDTSQPTIVPAPVTVTKADSPAAASAVTMASPKARVREAFAQLPLSEKIPAAAPMDNRKPQPKRKLAKARPVQQPAREPTILVAQQPHFGLFGNTW